MIKTSFWAVVILFLVSAQIAHATCGKEMEQANATAEKAMPISEGAKAIEAGAAGSAQSQSGQNITQNSGLASGAAATCSAAYADAGTKLAELLPSCNVPCQPKVPQEQPICNACKAASEKCKSTVSAHQAQVQLGQQGCQVAKEGADDTGAMSAALSQLPNLLQGLAGGKGGGGGGGDTASSLPVAATVAANCSAADSHMNPDCNEKTLVDCAGGASGSEQCESFGFRYCNPSSAGGTGEGIGTDACKTRMARQFCQNESNSSCPSCKQQQVQNSAYCQDKSRPCVGQSVSQQLDEARKTCPTDPLFADPKVAQTPPTNSGFSSASVGGGGGGSGGEMKPNAAIQEEKKKLKSKGDDLPGSIGSLDADGGGGGGYSGGGGGGYEGSGYSGRFGYSPMGAIGTQGAAGRTPSMVGSGAMLTAEVSASKSLFTMTTEAIKSRCVRGMLNDRCRP